jgi:cytochrome c2
MADVLAFLFEAANADRTGDPKAGERVFGEKGCARCHSVRSAGGHQAPDLAKVAGRGDTTAWICAMWNHAQSMVEPVERLVGQWPRFADREMNHLVTYAGIPASREGPAPRGNTDRGWRVFQNKCIQCHTVRGQGGSIGPELGPQNDLPLRPADFAGVLWNHAPAMLRQSREKGIAVAPLEPSDVTDLLRFLASLRYVEPAGTAFLGQHVFSERGCARCHGEKGEGAAMGPRIRNGAQAYTAASLAASLWKHGPKMVLRTEELDMPWPKLAATDVGDLVSFFNDPARGR